MTQAVLFYDVQSPFLVLVYKSISNCLLIHVPKTVTIKMETYHSLTRLSQRPVKSFGSMDKETVGREIMITTDSSTLSYHMGECVILRNQKMPH